MNIDAQSESSDEENIFDEVDDEDNEADGASLKNNLNGNQADSGEDMDYSD